MKIFNIIGIFTILLIIIGLSIFCLSLMIHGEILSLFLLIPISGLASLLYAFIIDIIKAIKS